MSRIRKFNENIDSESFLDIIKHETYILNDLKSDGIIDDLKYSMVYYNTDLSDYGFSYSSEYSKSGMTIIIYVGKSKEIKPENLESVSKELNHLTNKLKLDYLVTDLDIKISNSLSYLMIEFKIIQKNE